MDNNNAIFTIQGLYKVSRWIFLSCVVGLCLLCSFQMTAQRSKYFDVKEKEDFPDRIILSLKGTNKPSRLISDDYYLKDIGQFTEWNSSCLKVIFKQPDKKQMKLLKEIEFRIFLGAKQEVVYTEFEVPKKQIRKLLRMGKKLFNLACQYQDKDMSPFLRIDPEFTTLYYPWTIGRLDYLCAYDETDKRALAEAQRLFHVEEDFYRMEWKAIDGKTPMPGKPYNQSLGSKNFDEFRALTQSRLHAAFNELSEEELLLLGEARFSLLIGPGVKVYDFIFEFPKKYLPEMLKLREQINAFGRQYLAMDMSPYIYMDDSSWRGKFQWTFGKLNRIYKGDYPSHP